MEQIGLVRGAGGGATASERPPGQDASSGPADAPPAAPSLVSPTGSATSGGSPQPPAATARTVALPRLETKRSSLVKIAAAAPDPDAEPGTHPRQQLREAHSSPEPPASARHGASAHPPSPAASATAPGPLPPLHDRKPKRAGSRPRQTGSASSRDPSPRHESESHAAPRFAGAAAERPPLPAHQAADLPYFVADAAAAIPHAAQAPAASRRCPASASGEGGPFDDGGSDDGSENGLDGWDDDGSSSVAHERAPPPPKRAPPHGALHQHEQLRPPAAAFQGSPAAAATGAASWSSSPTAASAGAAPTGPRGRARNLEGGTASGGAAATAASPLIAALIAPQHLQSPRVGGGLPRRSTTSAGTDARQPLLQAASLASSSLALPVAEIGLGSFASHTSAGSHGGDTWEHPQPPVRRTQSYNAGDGVSRGIRASGAAAPRTSREARVAVTAGREPPPARVPVAVSTSTLHFDLPALFPPLPQPHPPGNSGRRGGASQR